MDCRFFNTLMNKYFDGEALPEDKKQLKDHIRKCSKCYNHFTQLEKSLALFQSASHIHAPQGFTKKVMEQLPPSKNKKSWMTFFKGHPLLVASSLFIILMSGSILSLWTDGGQEFQLTANHPEHLQIDEQRMTVVVPEDAIVEGDILVRNGSIEIKGEVKGNVVAIDGQVLLASTAAVSGQAEEIDQILEWIWYYIKKIF